MKPFEALSDALLGARLSPPENAARESVPDDVVLRSGGLVPRIGGFFARLGGPAAAVTLGRTIIVRPDTVLTRSLLAHELTHVRQWREDPLFPLRYAAATLRHGYWNNPYEIEAREAQGPAPTPTSDPSRSP